MLPDYDTGDAQLYVGDCRAVLAALPESSVQTAVTSPPYYGLRDYSIESQVWGGALDCPHAFGPPIQLDKRPNSGGIDGYTGRQRGEVLGRNALRGQYCLRCNAWWGDLGLEPTPSEFVAHLVEVCAAVRRVLRRDGTLWLNLGDSYANDGKWGGNTGGKHVRALHAQPIGRLRQTTGLKAKDLVGVPWRVAFALQEAGWHLRSDIIWHKPNPMPEAVKDRPTKAHEYLFLLSQSPRYFYDADAIRETNSSPRQLAHNQRYAKPYSKYDERAPTSGQPGNVNNVGIHARGEREGRNKRDVWSITAHPFPGAHFATFPPALVTPCVLAGSRPGDLVLDPFAGAGTTLMVAQQLGRRAVGIELNPDYAAMAAKRLTQPGLQLRTKEGVA